MKIGVIGGNGVGATNRLVHLIERKRIAAGAFRDQHHPELVVLYKTQSPSRSMYLEGRGPSFVEGYIEDAKDLKRLGCGVGCICCNTAHYAIDRIQVESGLPFINMLEEVAKKAKATGEKRFELFGTDGARKFNLYGAAFKALFPEAQIVYPSDERQKLVTRVICDVKNKARLLPPADSASPIAILKGLINTATAPVILGCTDLRVAYSLDERVDEKVAVDSLETLADCIIEKSGEQGGGYGLKASAVSIYTNFTHVADEVAVCIFDSSDTYKVYRV